MNRFRVTLKGDLSAAFLLQGEERKKALKEGTSRLVKESTAAIERIGGTVEVPPVQSMFPIIYVDIEESKESSLKSLSVVDTVSPLRG